jgi:ABC-type phosphate transport system substrate-binding protein
MKAKVRHFCALTVLVAALALSAQAKQMAVVVDKSNNLGGLTAAELAKVFKFDSRKWPDGRNVVLVMRDPSAPEMRDALEKVYHMQPDELRALIAAHRSEVIIVDSEEKLLKSVQSIPGAIGLVDVYSITGAVNVLKVDGKLPLQPGYLLKGTQ